MAKKKDSNPAIEVVNVETPIQEGLSYETPDQVPAEVTESVIGLESLVEDKNYIELIGSPKRLPISELVYEFNIRGTKAQLIGTKAVSELQKTLKEAGQIDPIKYFVNDAGEKVIFDGHCRVIALEQLGETTVMAQEIKPLPKNILSWMQLSTAIREQYDNSQKTVALCEMFTNNPDFFANPQLDAKKVSNQLGVNEHTYGIVKRAHKLGLIEQLSSGQVTVAAVKAIPSTVPAEFGQTIKDYLAKQTELGVEVPKVTQKSVKELLGVSIEVVEDTTKQTNSHLSNLANHVIPALRFKDDEFRKHVLEELANATICDEVYSTSVDNVSGTNYHLTLKDASELDETGFYAYFNTTPKVKLRDDVELFVRKALGLDASQNHVKMSWSEINSAIKHLGLSILVVYRSDVMMDAEKARQNFEKMMSKKPTQEDLTETASSTDELNQLPEDMAAVDFVEEE